MARSEETKYLTEYAVNNTKKVMEYFDVDTVSSFSKLVDSIREKYGVHLPSYTILYNLMNSNGTTKRTITALTELFNVIYGTNYSYKEYVEKELTIGPQSTKVGSFHGMFTCYTIGDLEREDKRKIKFGYMYIDKMEHQKYPVRAILNIETHDVNDYSSILKTLKTPNLKIEDYLNISSTWNPDNNYNVLYTGYMEVKYNYIRITLNLVSTEVDQEIIVYFRNIPSNIRKETYGSIGIMISPSFTKNMLAKRILVSKENFSADDSYIQRLLMEDESVSIYDTEDLQWHRHVKYKGAKDNEEN